MLSTTPRTLMLIDPDAQSVAALTTLATSAGWTVHGFTSAAGAIRDLRSLAPEVVATRLEMPVLSGRQVLMAVRTVDEELPVVIFSAGVEHHSALDLMRAGAFDCIARPRSRTQEFERVLERAHLHAASHRRRLSTSDDLREARETVSRMLEQESVIRQRAYQRLEQPFQTVFEKLEHAKETTAGHDSNQTIQDVIDLLHQIRDIMERAESDTTLTGQKAIRSEDFHLQEVIEFTRDALLDVAAERNLELAYYVPANLPAHRGNPQQLGSVLVGLGRFLMEDLGRGCVHFTVEVIDRDLGVWSLQIHVSDHLGNKKPESKDVLDQYLPDDSGDGTETAFDLSFLARGVGLLGGQLRFSVDRAVGRMFTLEVDLRRAKKPDYALPDAKLKPMNVLVAEPEGVVRRCISNELTKLGMQTAVAGSLDQTWSIIGKSAESNPIEVVFLSGAMVDADQLIEVLETMEAGTQPKVIWMMRHGEFTTYTESGMLLRPPKRGDLIAALRSCASA